MELSEEQKSFIDSNYHDIPDLIQLTRLTFNDNSLDGRTKEGRSVRSYLSQKGLNYKTTKKKKKDSISFSPEQKDFIVEYANQGMSSFQIAQLVFPDNNVVNLGVEQKAVFKYLEKYSPESIKSSESALGKTYQSPKGAENIIKIINKFTGEGINPNKISLFDKQSVEALELFLQSPRFLSIIHTYSDQEDRNLFEAEFVRATWDKSDLTADEVNLYINVCVDYINLKNISKHMEKLNSMFNDAEQQQELTVRLAELLKTKSEEYNQCEKRMESLINRLNGDRAKRVASKKNDNASILALVQAFQNEEERERMVMIAEKQKILVEEEADRLESMPSWKARVLGVSRGDVI
jgi:hypothetical protein